MNEKDGGPAFPAERQTRQHKGRLRTTNGESEVFQVAHEWEPGMSLRDYFAAKALQGRLASQLASPLRPRVTHASPTRWPITC